MLDYLGGPIDDDGEYYDDDGYAGGELYNEIVDFWENFNSEKDLLFVVSGKYGSDGPDLNGGRDYLLSRSNVIPMLFEYLYNNMGFTKDKYKDIIYNSLDITDEINGMFDDISVIRETKINNIINENSSKSDHVGITKANGILFVRYPSHMKGHLDGCEQLEFYGNSKVDDGLIYKLSIPKGYTVIGELSKYFI